jgi:hypothetical protein
LHGSFGWNDCPSWPAAVVVNLFVEVVAWLGKDDDGYLADRKAGHRRASAGRKKSYDDTSCRPVGRKIGA